MIVMISSSIRAPEHLRLDETRCFSLSLSQSFDVWGKTGSERPECTTILNDVLRSFCNDFVEVWRSHRFVGSDDDWLLGSFWVLKTRVLRGYGSSEVRRNLSWEVEVQVVVSVC